MTNGSSWRSGWDVALLLACVAASGLVGCDEGAGDDPGSTFIQEVPPGLGGVGGSGGSASGGEGGGGGFPWRSATYPQAVQMPGEAPGEARTTPTHAFVTAGDETQVYDIGQLERPRQVATLPATGSLLAADQNARLPLLTRTRLVRQRAADGIALREVPSSELQVFDVHSPVDPRLVARVPLGASAFLARRLSSFLFVAAREPGPDYTGAQDALVLLALDLADPEHPREVMRLSAGENRTFLANGLRRANTVLYDGGDHFLLSSSWRSGPSPPGLPALTAFELDPVAATIRERPLLAPTSDEICWAGYSPPRDGRPGVLVTSSLPETSGRGCGFSVTPPALEMWTVPPVGDPVLVERSEPGPLRALDFDPQRRRLTLTELTGDLQVIDLHDPSLPARTTVAGVGAFHRLAPIGDGRFALATGLAPPGVCEDPDFTPEPSYPIRLPPLGGPAVSLIDIGDPALGTGFRLVQRLCGGGPTPTMAGYGPTVTGRLATFYRGRASLFDWNLPALATGGNALTRILDWQQERDAWGGLFHDVRMTEVPGGAGFLLHSYTHLAGLTADGPTGPLLGPLVSRLDGPQELFTLDSHLALLMSPGGATPTSRELQIQALPLQPGAPPLASLELPAGEGRLLQHQQLLVFVSRSCSTRPDGACAAGQSWQVFDLRSPG
jgi:hypothetical protein